MSTSVKKAGPQLSFTKVILTIIIITGLSLLSWAIVKGFGKQCAVDYEYNDTLKKCINSCPGQYKDGKGGCLPCSPGSITIPGFTGCYSDCSKAGPNMKPCGNVCYNSMSQNCDVNHLICNTSNYAPYKNSCCSNSTYTQATSQWFPNGFVSLTIPDMINEMKNNTSLMASNIVSSSDITQLQGTLSYLGVTTVAELLQKNDGWWLNMNTSDNMKDLVLRPALGLNTCSTCPSDRAQCGFGAEKNCCGPDQLCAGNQCCDKENVHGDNCCSIFTTQDGCCGPGQSSRDGGKTCSINCGDGITFCPASQQKCINIDYVDSNGNPTGRVDSTCQVSSSCSFNEMRYDPTDIQIPGKKSLPVCSLANGGDSLTPVAYCNSKYFDLSKYTKFAHSDQTSQKGSCSEQDCLARVAENGVQQIVYSPDNETCYSQLSCYKVDGVKDSCNYGECPVDNNSRCCQVGGDYSGLICPEGAICLNDICADGNSCDNGTCADGSVCKKNACSPGWIWNNKTGIDADVIRSISPTDTNVFSVKQDALNYYCNVGNNGIAKAGECCGSGWKYINGKCYQKDIPNDNTLLATENGFEGIWSCRDTSGGSSPPSPPRTSDYNYGLCGGSWMGFCAGAGSSQNDHDRCFGSYASGGNPNQRLKYCICDNRAVNWVNSTNSNPNFDMDSGSNPFVITPSNGERMKCGEPNSTNDQCN